jgi:SNARE protein
LILGYTFLIIIGIAVIVVYKAMYPEDSTFYVPDEVTPPNPVALYNKTMILVNQRVISINNS